MKCALADYYRNVHMFFQKGADKCELDSSEEQYRKMKALKWSKDWFEKIYLFFYARYTHSQEKMSPSCQHLLLTLKKKYGNQIPTELRQHFRVGSKPLMKYTNILTFDMRAGVLFISVLIKEPWLYMVFEVTVMNVIFFYMRSRHEKLCKEIELEAYK
jgi:hypothetical protein